MPNNSAAMFVFIRWGGRSMARRRTHDQRVEKTQRQLREALVSLIHEKGYDAIVVKEILDRAEVGRTAFYAHFSGKDALLADGLGRILHEVPPRRYSSDERRFERLLWFSLPMFEYIGQHRHDSEVGHNRHDRAVIHEHLRHTLMTTIAADLRATPLARVNGVPSDLLVGYVVSTFVLVLNWWVDGSSPLAPREVDDLFLALVLPALNAAEEASR
jgi:AcrR family transcriptional regulator